MPADATITEYNVFSPLTKIRSAEVNTNFSNYRGHIVPIDPNTATGSDNTYDLGSPEYRWRNAYIQGLGTATSQLPSWKRYNVLYTDINSAATATSNASLFTNPTSGSFSHIAIKLNTAFAGGSITDLKGFVGTSSDPEAYTFEFDLTQAVTATAKQLTNYFDVSFDTTTSIVMKFTATGANLDSLTAGDVDVFFLRSQLP